MMSVNFSVVLSSMDRAGIWGLEAGVSGSGLRVNCQFCKLPMKQPKMHVDNVSCYQHRKCSIVVIG